MCVCVYMCSVVSDSLQSQDFQSPLSMEFSRQEFHGIFLTQGLNPCLLPMSPALQVDSLPLSHWGKCLFTCSIGIQICYFSHMDNWLFQNIYWNIYPYILLVVCSYTFPMYQVFIEAGVYFRILSSIRQFASPLTNTTILITTSLWEALIFGSIGSSTSFKITRLFLAFSSS